MRVCGAGCVRLCMCADGKDDEEAECDFVFSFSTDVDGRWDFDSRTGLVFNEDTAGSTGSDESADDAGDDSTGFKHCTLL